jgi:hypothetical protein
VISRSKDINGGVRAIYAFAGRRGVWSRIGNGNEMVRTYASMYIRIHFFETPGPPNMSKIFKALAIISRIDRSLWIFIAAFLNKSTLQRKRLPQMHHSSIRAGILDAVGDVCPWL